MRFFGGFQLSDALHDRHDAVSVGYQKGVPMGGDLEAAAGKRSPRFLVMATRDPESAPLQKIQIVKGWVEGGEERARVCDVACSDGATPDSETKRCPDNGARVELATCAINLDKGDGQLATMWSDPDFDPAKRAVYYARVLETPVCRWTTHDAHRIGAALPEHVPATIEERAWTSPIWYAP